MEGLVTLADLPELQGTEAKPRSTIVIGRLDDNLRDPRYGRFAIKQAQVDAWKRNLAGAMGGQVSIDFDHSSDRGNGTRAAAWIKDIGQDGNLITADVEFTKRGARAVRNGDYRYTSPTFVEQYTDEHGVKHGPALIGAALTNRPVLRKGMPTLSLSLDEFEGVELAKVSAKTRQKTATLKGKGKPEFPMPDAEHARLALQFVGRSLKKGNISPEDAAKIRARANKMLGNGKKSALSRDSRGHMLSREELATALDLQEDADSDAILAAACVTLGQEVPEPKVLSEEEQAAKAEKKARKQAKKAKALAQDNNGTLTLSQDQYAELLEKANAGQAAALQLAEQKFQTAWQKALSEGRAAPAQEDTVKALYQENPELAIKTLDSFVKIVPTVPTGSGEGPSTGPAPNGMDDERFQLHTEAKQLAEQKVKTDPSLDAGEAYALAAQEIEERKFALENPGI